MSYSPLIISSEFRDHVKLGANVGKSGELETYIRKFQENKFKPIVPSAFYTDITGSLTSRPELNTFLQDYVKPFLISGAYENFLLWHGRNVSQFGLRQNNEETSEAISDKARAELMADIRSETNVCLADMTKQWSDLNYTFDGTAYGFNSCGVRKSGANIGIKQVGRRR